MTDLDVFESWSFRFGGGDTLCCKKCNIVTKFGSEPCVGTQFNQPKKYFYTCPQCKERSDIIFAGAIGFILGLATAFVTLRK